MNGWYKTPSKYHNIRTEVDGITFASKAEARRYSELVLMKHCGVLTTLGCQPSFVVAPGVRYVADFLCIDQEGSIWVEDVKGVETQAFKIKRRLFEAAYPGIKLRIIR